MYKKLFTRELTLILSQVWYRGEVVDPQQWTDQEKPHFPYLVFEKTLEATDVYASDEGLAEVGKELERKLQTDPDFVQRVVTRYYETIKNIRAIWEEERALSKDDLLSFLKQFQLSWPWFDAIYWLVDILDKKNDPRFDSVMDVRKDVEMLGIGADTVIENSLEKIFPEFSDYFDVISFEDLQSADQLDWDVLKKRKQGLIFTGNQLFVDTSLAEIEKKYGIQIEKLDIDEDIKEFKGRSACKGKAMGKVRRIMGFSKVHTMKEGEILVTGMTIPNFLPAMKKAAAIITDEGGITCHAAIVARELGKPCIIGTKIATQVLKDGDEVEVDADEGIVRIKKRADYL